jgi:predicted Zn finger-like uncharacterized protein
MILTCPSCRSRYQADSARFLPNGRNVRCAKCGQVWFQPAPQPEPAAEAASLEPAAAMEGSDSLAEAAAVSAAAAQLGDFGPADFGVARTDSEDVPQAPHRAVRPRRLKAPPPAQVAGWAVLILMVAGIGWSAVQFRQTIANLWPETASVYAALGMPVNVRGMALVNIAYQQDFEDGQPVLSVTGKVVNISNHELPVPGLRVVLTDDSKHELYRWTFDVGVPTLKAGAESSFVTRLSSPPPEARNLNITFADASQ